MDKLYDFKKGKINDENTKLYRFQCDCLTASDAMDIMVDSQGKDDEDKYLTICLDLYSTSLWGRIKDALRILRGHWTWREFCPRIEDYQNYSDIFNPSRKYSELP